MILKDDLSSSCHWWDHGRMTRGGHGPPKVSLGPAMLYPSTPCGRATPETALWPFQRRPAAFFYPIGHPTLYAYPCFIRVFSLDCNGRRDLMMIQFNRHQRYVRNFANRSINYGLKSVHFQGEKNPNWWIYKFVIYLVYNHCTDRLGRSYKAGRDTNFCEKLTHFRP
jgi:hypothetical protein